MHFCNDFSQEIVFVVHRHLRMSTEHRWKWLSSLAECWQHTVNSLQYVELHCIPQWRNAVHSSCNVTDWPCCQCCTDFWKLKKKSEIDITSYSKAHPGNWIWEKYLRLCDYYYSKWKILQVGQVKKLESSKPCFYNNETLTAKLKINVCFYVSRNENEQLIEICN